jgi:hypothetical protein
MKVDILVNGKMSLIIMPENEMEKQMLAEIIKTPCAVTAVEKGSLLMQKQIENSLIVSQVIEK